MPTAATAVRSATSIRRSITIAAATGRLLPVRQTRRRSERPAIRRPARQARQRRRWIGCWRKSPEAIRPGGTRNLTRFMTRLRTGRHFPTIWVRIRCTGSTVSNIRAQDGWQWRTQWGRRQRSRAAMAQATASRRGSSRITRICRNSTRSCRISMRRRAASMTARGRRFLSAMR